MIDIAPTLALCSRHAAPSRDVLRTWSMVLESQELLSHADANCLRVSPPLAARAMEQILAYEAENIPTLPRPQTPDRSWISMAVIALTLACMAGIDTLRPEIPWHQLGRVNAGLILKGEWWRCVTALFLHADAGHLLANITALALLTALLGRNLGFGLIWGLFILTGGTGNALNAWAHPPTHLSVGASTGVFGLLGILACMARSNRTGHIFIVLGFALSFLALLGAGGERVDLGAHAFGLMAGLAAGAALSILRLHPWTSPVIGSLALTLTVGSWFAVWTQTL